MPSLYSQGNERPPGHPCQILTPDSNWTWYVTEGSAEGDDFIFFGFVIGFEKEWGYFSLSELTAARGPMGLEIERDLYFEPGPFEVVMVRECR